MLSTATSFMKRKIGKMRPKVIEIAMWANDPLLLIQWKKSLHREYEKITT
jgi:hypothetical protein